MDKVLIVDDDAQLLTIIADSLKKYRNKFQVATANDGLGAIKALQRQAFSVVVTDIQMPKINGLVLLAYMAKNHAGIPCIIMTEHETQLLKKRLKQETLHYIEKPFEVRKLAKAIMTLLGQEENLGGTLNGISLISFVSLIEMECSTCVCHISSPDGEKGHLLFDEGVLYNASCGDLLGKEAALRLLQMRNVTIEFGKPPEKDIPRRIEMELPALIEEAMNSEESKGTSKTRDYKRPAQFTNI